MADLEARIRSRLDSTPPNRPDGDLADALRFVLDECSDLESAGTFETNDAYQYAAWCIRDRIRIALGVDDD